MQASSEYPGWPASNVLDHDESTSWFSGGNDSVARGSQPWLLFSLSRPARLRLVRVLGNRNPSFPLGYSVLELRMDVLDGEGQVLASEASRSPAPPHDFMFSLRERALEAHGVRLTVLLDEGGKNPYGDVALGEVQIELEQEAE